MSELLTLNLSQVIEPEHKLREHNPDSESYKEMVENIRVHGVLEPVQVVRKDDFFMIVNGNNRFHASQELGLETIDAKVLDANEKEQLLIQLATNAIKVETTPAEYGRQLIAIMDNDSLMTVTKLAKLVGKGKPWVQARLKMNKLCDEAADLVDADRITVVNACKLADLPKETQVEFVKDAEVMPSEEFIKVIDEKIALIEQARAGGDAATEAVFIMKPKRLSTADIEKVIDNDQLLHEIVTNELYGDSLSSIEACFSAGLEYAISMDPITRARLLADFEDKKLNTEESKRKKKSEALKKRAERTERQNQHRTNMVKIQMEGVDAGKTDEEVEAELLAYKTANDLLPKKKATEEVAVEATEEVVVSEEVTA